MNAFRHSARAPAGRAATLALGLLVAWPAAAAVVNRVQVWPDGDRDGWRLLNQVSGLYHDDRLSASGGDLEWSYAESDPESLFSVEAMATSSGGGFTGDYFDVGATGIRFTFFSETETELEVELWNEASMQSYSATTAVVPGWQTLSLPLLPEVFQPWMGSASAEELQALLAGVTRLWITARRRAGSGTQGFRLGRLEITGSGPGYGAWIRSYGGTAADWLPAADWDSDGVINAEEYVAGTAPNDARDWLFVWLEAPPLTLHWQSVTGRTYSVWRAPGSRPEEAERLTVLEGTGLEMDYQDDTAQGLDHKHYHLQVGLQTP